MSTLTPSSAHPQRAPPPSLFLGPPSRNASNISLTPVATQPTSSNQSRAPLLRTRSTRATDPASALGRSRPEGKTAAQNDGDRTDALWAEMQATLADVEMNALNSTHVFGPAHSAALDELREAQIQLAQAWGKSGTEGGDGAGDFEKSKNIREDDGNEKTDEDDILEARKRREANERFFQRVREGVADVVGKLEDVAAAMGKVESQSRDIWSSSGSVGTRTSTES